MRAVVTGGAGFIGSHLVEHLMSAGHDVVVLDDFSTGRYENIAPWLDRLTLIEGSVADLASCVRACDGADYVFHQAALASVPRSLADPVATHNANANGTLNVLIAARDAGAKRVVYAASSSAYGNSATLPKHEDMTVQPLSPYAVSKCAGEGYMRAFHASFGVPTISLRYFNIFGPRQDPTSQYSAVIPRFITSALSGTPQIIYGDGEQTRDFTFVANVVRACMLACEAPPEACGGVYNVGCGNRISLNQLWQRIVALTGSTARVQYGPPRPGDVRDSLACLKRSRQMLGYEPVVGVDEGLQASVQDFGSATALAVA